MQQLCDVLCVSVYIDFLLSIVNTNIKIKSKSVPLLLDFVAIYLLEMQSNIAYLKQFTLQIKYII